MNLLTRQSCSAPSRSIELASVSLETDTSEHSYTLQDIRVERSAAGESDRPARPSLDEMAAVSPFAMAQMPAGPSTSPAFTAYRQRMGMKARPAFTPPEPSPATSGALSGPENTARPPRRSLHVGRARSVPLRVSIDLPKGHSPEQTAINLADTELKGRLVRKRRRLPLQFVVLFGIVSSLCLLVGLTTLSIGIYNFTKLKAGRAAKSIADLEDELLPMLQAIMDKLARR